MGDKWLTNKQALAILGSSEEYNMPGILVQRVEQAHALAAAKRALRYRIAKTALYDKENNCHVCPSCKGKLERSDYEFNTGYCKVCGQKIEFQVERRR